MTELGSLRRTAFRFGHFGHGDFGTMVFGENGRVKCYLHQNETSYTASDDKVSFFDSSGVVTSTLVKVGPGLFYAESGFRGLYLAPVLTLHPPKNGKRRAKLLVNTIPKSGTYLIERILSDAEFNNVKLHAGDISVDDNRHVCRDQIHYRPQERRVAIAASALCSLLSPSEFTVGHVSDVKQLEVIRAEGFIILNVVRDLRNVLVSYYHFLKEKVAATSPSDQLWRTLSGQAGFIAFLSARAGEEITLAMNVAESISQIGEPFVRFEELETQSLSPDTRVALDKIEHGFADEFVDLLSKSINKPTSTLSSARADYKQYWNEDIQRFFNESGLAKVNSILGYL